MDDLTFDVNKNVYIVELPLNVEIWQADIINKRLEIGRSIFNALLGKVVKRYNEMIKTKLYRNLKIRLTELKELGKGKLTKEKKKNIEDERKTIYEQLNLLELQYKLTKYDIVNEAKEMQHYFKYHLHSRVVQEIAKQVHTSLNSVMHGKGEKVHFKKFGTFNSLQSNEKNQAIIFDTDTIKWTGLTLPINYSNSVKSKEYVQRNVFDNLHNLRYCTIVRKCIRGKNRYYVQLTFKSTIPQLKHKLGKGRVGIDIGTSTIALSSDKTVNILELADRVQSIEKQKAKLLRRIDKSRRANNPNKYNEDGTYKKVIRISGIIQNITLNIKLNYENFIENKV